ncbi:tubulin--tyrosine ligase [Spiromyces aspiralis]|uniref:Tubulin--tyrosine ligase n=1 Tax=Spiromyces aspiralis TaxID=68401 RepID=A0ACC1HDI4_9FUNG|nr:tubulin--tyrosine ligase [Spiromyces aspiralis]
MCHFLWVEYEDIDWEYLQKDRDRAFACSYCIRKGLIRKAQMAHNFRLFMAKNPDSCLATHVPETWVFDLDCIDYLDEALQECYEVEQALTKNQQLINSGEASSEEIERFILKPSLTGRGAGIYIFDTLEKLQHILESELESDSEDESEAGQYDWQALSQIREFVIQRYIDRPLLLAKYGKRKFHIRTYVLCVGAVKVYVYNRMLALFATDAYDEKGSDLTNMSAHLTNTCLQSRSKSFDEGKAVELFSELATDSADLSPRDLDAILEQIRRIVAECFAAVVAQPFSFQPWPNCLEQFGFDFLVDTNHRVYLLEANSYPDFKQTGKRLEGLVDEFMDASIRVALSELLLPRLGQQVPDELQQPIPTLDLVYEKDLNR